MSFHLSIMPEQAIIRGADASKPTKRRVDDTNHPKVVLDFDSGASQYAYFRLPLPPQDEVGTFDTDTRIDIQYTSTSVLTGNVQFGIKYAIVDLAEGQDKALSSEVASTTSSYTGSANTHYGVSFSLTGVFSTLDTTKRYVLVVQLTRKAPASDLAANVSVVGGVCRLRSRVEHTHYNNPILPQFSRWSPEIYLPLNGSITDESANAWTLTQMGAVPSDFVADSPFGSGESLRVNPNGAGVTSNRQNIDSAANATMSYVSGQNFPPWSMGFWFKASATPTVAFVAFQTAIPWVTYGKGVQIVNTTGRLQIYQFGSSNYEPTTTNLCDGNWHHIMIRYARYSTGKVDELNGKVWIDGVAVGVAAASAFNQPPSTPTTKMLAGGDTVQTYYLSDFWYTNSIPPDDLASLLWNGGSGRRYNSAGLL